MKRKAIIFTGALLLTLAAVSMAFAFGGGNGRKGKFLYRKSCRSCHGKTASDLSPATKTQAEWTALFKDVSKLPCNKEWQGLPDKDLNDIFTYLHDYAKDSPTPAKCS